MHRLANSAELHDAVGRWQCGSGGNMTGVRAGVVVPVIAHGDLA